MTEQAAETTEMTPEQKAEGERMQKLYDGLQKQTFEYFRSSHTRPDEGLSLLINLLAETALMFEIPMQSLTVSLISILGQAYKEATKNKAETKGQTIPAPPPASAEP